MAKKATTPKTTTDETVVQPVVETPQVEEQQIGYPTYIVELTNSLNLTEHHKKDTLLQMIQEGKSKQEIYDFLCTIMSVSTSAMFELKEYFNS